MVDFINQGKGDVCRIWDSIDTKKLTKIYLLCNKMNIDFYNPTETEIDTIEKKLLNTASEMEIHNGIIDNNLTNSNITDTCGDANIDKNNDECDAITDGKIIFNSDMLQDNKMAQLIPTNIVPYVSIKYKLVNPNAKPPIKKTNFSSGFDLAICQDVTVAPFGIALADTGIAFEVPEFIDMQIRPRSSTSAKYRQIVAIGTIDPDYRGTVKIVLLNFSLDTINFGEGVCLAQAVFNYKPNIVLEEENELSETVRGVNGFGHTGMF